MTTPQERAAQLWFELSVLIPIAEGEYDYQALVASCEALIVKALVPPIDKLEAFDRLIDELSVAGVMDVAPVIEALYVYREALLSWQRGILDEKARDAELAIRALRGYTRSNETPGNKAHS